MGQESVRKDFLAGRNGAALLGEEDLKYLDDLYSEVSPKHGGDDGVPSFEVCLNILHVSMSMRCTKVIQKV